MQKPSYTEQTAKYIQNFGEQHPDFHSIEMRRWRKVWNSRVYYSDLASLPPEVCPSSLDENLHPIDSTNSAHVWDDSTTPITCAECGTIKE